MAGVGLKTKGGRWVELVGACFDAASAYNGTADHLGAVEVKLKDWLGELKAFLISARVVSMLASRFLTASGILHPKALAPARVLSICWSSSSVVKR